MTPAPTTPSVRPGGSSGWSSVIPASLLSGKLETFFSKMAVEGKGCLQSSSAHSDEAYAIDQAQRLSARCQERIGRERVSVLADPFHSENRAQIAFDHPNRLDSKSALCEGAGLHKNIIGSE